MLYTGRGNKKGDPPEQKWFIFFQIIFIEKRQRWECPEGIISPSSILHICWDPCPDCTTVNTLLALGKLGGRNVFWNSRKIFIVLFHGFALPPFLPAPSAPPHVFSLSCKCVYVILFSSESVDGHLNIFVLPDLLGEFISVWAGMFSGAHGCNLFGGYFRMATILSVVMLDEVGI